MDGENVVACDGYKPKKARRYNKSLQALIRKVWYEALAAKNGRLTESEALRRIRVLTADFAPLCAAHTAEALQDDVRVRSSS